MVAFESQEFSDFAELADHACTYMQLIDEVQRDVFAGIAKALRDHAQRGGDLPVDKSLEEQKRETIKFWREMADYMELLSHAFSTLPVDGASLAEQIRGSLESGWEIAKVTAWPEKSAGIKMDDFFRERANNLAQAFAGRLLPE